MAFNAYMHKRNIYRNQPDFTQIALDYPEFRKYAIPDAKGQKVRVDFTNPEALRMLTKILLKKDFNLDVEIPHGFLIPTVPQRLNYILWIEDLLSNVSVEKECIKGIDIGTGPCAIFSILGAQKNGWKFIATESSEDAISWAEKNISKNNLSDKINVVKVSKGSALKEVLSVSNEDYDFCLCNPPFFESIEEIRTKHRYKNQTIADVAQNDEIFAAGGELDFVKNILKDSLIYKDRISLFTSMFGKKKSLLETVKEIQEIKDIKFTTTEFCQGNTVRWGIAWTFKESIFFEEEVQKKVKPKKTKPPLQYQIPLKKSENIFDNIVNQAKGFLKFLQIPITVTKSSKKFVEFLIKSEKNTWSHQRRKRRELERQKKERVNPEDKNCSAATNEIEQISTKNSNSEDTNSFSNASNESSKNVLDLKLSENIENSHLTKNETVIEHCSELNSENKKRKMNPTSQDIVISKKARIEDISNTLSKTTHLKDQNIKTDNNHELYVTNSKNVSESHSPSTSSESNIKEIETQNKSIFSKDTICSEAKIHVDQKSSDSLHETICIPTDDEISSNEAKSNLLTTENVENASISMKVKPDEKTENIESENFVLYCYLQFIKAKNKIYVKMNCPSTADRNTMHQVFQLIKNKIK